MSEIARLDHDGRLLTVRQVGNRIMIANEDDITAQSVVLTAYELRWLVHCVFGDPNPIPRWRFWRDDLRYGWRRIKARAALTPEEPKP